MVRYWRKAGLAAQIIAAYFSNMRPAITLILYLALVVAGLYLNLWLYQTQTGARFSVLMVGCFLVLLADTCFGLIFYRRTARKDKEMPSPVDSSRCFIFRRDRREAAFLFRARYFTNVRYWRWSQPVDATPILNR